MPETLELKTDPLPSFHSKSMSGSISGNAVVFKDNIKSCKIIVFVVIKI